jgi:hypothetical protein
MRKEFADMTLAELAYTRGTLEGYIQIAITQARRGGSTWAAIGSSLGVSPQEAHRRYSWLQKLIDQPTAPSDGP